MADAFDNLLSARAEKGAKALDLLVEQLNTDKERTIYDFLNNRGSEDVLWALLSMLSSENTRIASNSAFVIGSLAETEEGSTRILTILKLVDQKNLNALENLTRMLEVEDAETVMNAAGTLGTLAETEQGRSWILDQDCANTMMTNTTFLLGSENHWTASNSALVLARMTISERGRKAMLDHPRSNYILQRLIQSLGNDTAGRGMNAAFAIGRLLDTNNGKERLLNGSDADKMTTSLCRMLAKGDMGGAKNACFAISCLAADADGNQLVLVNSFFQDAVNRLVLMLQNEDSEACWFAAMTLKTISSHKHGVLCLRKNGDVESSLAKVLERPQLSKELNDEVTTAIANLKKLAQPDPPYVEVIGSTSVRAMWNRVLAGCGFQVTYKLICDNKIIYKGPNLEYVISDLHPYTPYSIKLRASTMGDDSPYSETVTVTTDEDVPTAPTFLRVMGCTPTQLRLTWNAPERCNGVMRGYYIYLGQKLLECIQDSSYIISRLTPATKYTVSVCASTSKGTGDRATVGATTEELGAHAPEKPTVTVIGRNEMQVSWMPPSVPLGRFFRYELCMNERVVYQGIDKFHRVTGLTPDTEYIFVAVAITSEGRCPSDPTKKKTPKDKSQNEPGHHQLKTHSFKAKEFQAMQEKSKSNNNVIPPIQRPKPKLKKRSSTVNRPGSNMSLSNASDISGTTDGTWAVSTNEPNEHAKNSDDVAQIEDKQKTKKKFHNAAVIGGAQIPPHQRILLSTSASAISEARCFKSGDAKTMENSCKETYQTHPVNGVIPMNTLSGTNKDSISREHTFDKENRRQLKTSSMTRTRYRRGHAVMKGKRVLKSDKELLSEMVNHGPKQKTPEPNRKMHSDSSYGQRTMHYYPDIVSAIRTQYGHESTVAHDLQKGRLTDEISSDSPDSLNPEPGTARNDLDMNFGISSSKVKSRLIKNRYLRETPDENSFRTYPGSWTSSARSFTTPNGVSKSAHVVVKPTVNSKYGLKYNIHSNHSYGTASSTEADSAFQASPNVRENLEDFSGNVTDDGYSDRLRQTRTISRQLMTPLNGYWSDHDVSQSQRIKKPLMLSAINYRKFQGAHRPAKSKHLESPAVSTLDNSQWIVGESVYGNDMNRQKFLPTRWKTQHGNLPAQPKSGQMRYRLEVLNDRVKQMEAADRKLRATSNSSNQQSNTRSSHSTLTSSAYRRRAVNTTENFVTSSKDVSNGSNSHTMADDISTSVLRLKTGSILAALNYQRYREHNAAPTHTKMSYSRQKAATSVPHTILSPLSPSEVSTSSNTGSNSNISSHSPKSPRLRLTTSSPVKARSIVPTATGYAISPHQSLSSMSNDGHVSRLTAVIPSAGDLV